jgi:hypothetical protein
MDYGKFIRTLKKAPIDVSTEKRIWNKISRTIQKNDVGILSFAEIWAKFLVPAVALAAVFVIFFYNYEKQLEVRSFVQSVYSTENIYSICKYDPQWN